MLSLFSPPSLDPSVCGSPLSPLCVSLSLSPAHPSRPLFFDKHDFSARVSLAHVGLASLNQRHRRQQHGRAFVYAPSGTHSVARRAERLDKLWSSHRTNTDASSSQTRRVGAEEESELHGQSGRPETTVEVSGLRHERAERRGPSRRGATPGM